MKKIRTVVEFDDEDPDDHWVVSSGENDDEDDNTEEDSDEYDEEESDVENSTPLQGNGLPAQVVPIQSITKKPDKKNLVQVDPFSLQQTLILAAFFLGIEAVHLAFCKFFGFWDWFLLTPGFLAYWVTIKTCRKLEYWIYDFEPSTPLKWKDEDHKSVKFYVRARVHSLKKISTRSTWKQLGTGIIQMAKNLPKLIRYYHNLKGHINRIEAYSKGFAELDVNDATREHLAEMEQNLEFLNTKCDEAAKTIQSLLVQLVILENSIRMLEYTKSDELVKATNESIDAAIDTSTTILAGIHETEKHLGQVV